MLNRTGRFKIIEQFLADGMNHMFGNPGTVEQGFLDAIEQYAECKYVLCLHESIAVMIADGYARSTKRPALVQLHSSPGIGNAVGALYQAKRGHSPLVVIGGDAGTRYLNMDAQMAADLVAMMEPVTKYATTVYDSRSLLRTLRRAIKIACTPPMGPVYVCLPMDILDEINQEDVHPTVVPSTRTRPDQATIDRIATMLLAAGRPMIFAGDGVAYSGATVELARLAELLGAEVYGVDVGDFIMDQTHPLYQGTTGHMFGEQSMPITTKGDVNIVVGTYMMPEVFPALGPIFAPGAKVIHVDLNAYEIAKNHPVDIGVVADPKLTIAALCEALEKRLNKEQTDAARKRAEKIGGIKTAKQAAAIESDKAHAGGHPLMMCQFMQALAARLPQDAIIFDEALTNSPAIARYFPPKAPGASFVTRGGSLGVGIPGAIGIKTARPDRTVVGFTGDGGSMYTIQALWTAARHVTGAKFVVCNNGSYGLLQANIGQYWKERHVAAHDYPLCFDLSRPALRFDLLAQAMGVDAVRVERSDEIEPAVARMLSDDKPFLIDLILGGDVKPELIGVKCGQ